MSNQKNSSDHHHGNHHHFVLPDSLAFKVWGALILGTIITVLVSLVNLGWLNLPVALLVASVKASLVCLYFMGLKYDDKENVVIFTASFLFVAIFIVFTFSDVFFRSEPKSVLAIAQKAGPSKFKKAWKSSPELIAHGKGIYQQQCVICHGEKGEGNGPASAGLNPKPRNFTVESGWKNGRKGSQIFTTLTKGLGSMPAFGNLSSDDRWGLTHYVIAFAGKPADDSEDDLKKLGIDSSKDDGGAAGVEKSIPIGLAIELLSEDGKYR